MWCALKSFPNIVPRLLDAKDLRTNKLVCIKRVGKKTNELEIGRYLVPESSESLQDPNNHCVPILDAFSDPVHCDISYIVMPLLGHLMIPNLELLARSLNLLHSFSRYANVRSVY